MSSELAVVTAPEYVKVKIGNSIFELAYESLIASMTHQYLSNNFNLHANSDYDMIFEVTKDMIAGYVYDSLLKEEYIDMFGEWIESFVKYQTEKNKSLCKDINIKFSNGSVWQVKLLDLLAHKYNQNGDGDLDFEIDYEDPILTDESKALEYLCEIGWEEVFNIAEEIEKPQPEPNYEDMFTDAEKVVVPWEKEVSIIDFFDITDIISMSEEEEDED